MKKLLIMLCAVAMSICANAATTKWGLATTADKYLYEPGSTTSKLTGSYTAYIFCSATADTDTTATLYSQSDILNSVRSGTDISTLKYQATADVVGAAIANKSFTSEDFAASKSVTMFFVIVDETNERVFISGTNSKTSNVTAEQGFTINPQTASQRALSTEGFASAGWYASTPEPTSGLMLLLGVGLMALKRKRV